MAISVKFACLLSVIDENELEALPQEIRSKLEDTISSKESAIEKSKAENERLKVNAEQQYFELEKQLISCSAKLETINSERNELKTENTDLETKYKLAQERLRELEDNKEGSLSTQLQLSRTNEQLETDKRDLVELVEKKNQEIERLNDEWHNLSEKLGVSNTAKVQAQAKLDELLGEDVTAKYREKRLEQEKDLLSQQNDWMSKELKEKTNELLAFKRTKSAEILELKTTLETQSEELKHSQEVFETVKKTNEIQSSRIEALIQKVKDVHDAAAQNEEQSRNELAAQTKLTGLYKSVADEFKGKETEMMTTIEELQKILRQTTESHTEMEDQMKEIEEKHIEKERLLEEKVESLEKELVHANDLIAVAKRKGISPLSESELSTLSPTAAAASSLLKSGMTLTQMYSAYVESSDDLQLEKEENRRLNMYLDQILKEIEEKAPVLQKQREDYEKSLQTIDQLSRRLDGAMLECEKLRVTADESERKAAQQLRENNRMVQQTSDLGQQVRVLLKEIEEARGHVSGSHEAHVSSSDISSSSNLISEKLVTFRNIEELQEQNQQLLTVVRELSSKREQEEKATRDEELSEVHEKLEKALEEIDELRTSRNRQGEMVEGIVRQRDMYRVLLAQRGDATIPLMTPGSHSPLAMSTPAPPSQTSPLGSGDTADSTATAEAKAALGQLNKEFETYRKEKAENEKIINDQMDKLRSDMSDMRVQNAKLLSQLEFSSERFNILQSNVEGYKKEIESLKDKNHKYASQTITHQQRISTLTQDLMGTQEKLSKAEVDCTNLKAERDLLKKVEDRLVQEIDSLRREQRGQNLLLTNLQTIQNNLERAEFETKARLTNQIESLERDVNSYKRRLDAEAEQHKVVIKSWESQVKSLRGQLDNELENHQKTKEDMANVKQELQNLKQQCSVAESKLASTEIRLSNALKEKGQDVSMEPTSTTDEEVKELKSQINKYQQDIKGLREQLNKAKQHVEQYKSISDAVDESLREQNAASKIFKETTEAKLKEATEMKAGLKKQLLELENEKQQIMLEKKQLQQAVDSQTSELRSNLTKMQDELKDALQKCTDAQANEQAARSDCKKQSELAAECQDKYEREFLLRASDVQQLVTVKEQLAGFNTKLSEAEDIAKRAIDELSENKASWEVRLRTQQDECDEFRKRCEELNKQNGTLHEQLEGLSQQLIAFQQRGSTQSVADLSFSEENKSSDQLLEIIRFVRREKDIAETKYEVAQAEAIRHKQKCEHLQKELNESFKNLQEERERSQVTAKTTAQHQDLMNKIETLNILTDSNKLLREEKERVDQQLQQMVAKVKQLEENVAPLQEQNRALTSKVDVLVLEKNTLTADVNRWKNKTNTKADPEQYKKLVEENESNKKTISQLTEENQRQKAELSRLNSLVSNTQAEVRNSKLESTKQKSETTKLNEELEKIKKEVETKNTSLEEMKKNIAQVKKIGRRYKTWYDELKKQTDDKQAEPQSQQPTASQANAELEASVKAKDEQIQKLNEEMGKLKTEIEKLNENLTKVKESEETIKMQLNDKDEKTKKLLMSAKQKISQLTGQREKQNSEAEELKTKVTNLEKTVDEKEKQVNAIKSQHEHNTKQLEQQLKEAKNDFEKFKQGKKEEQDKIKKELDELESLKKKVLELQKQLEEQQKQLQAQQQQQQQQQQQPPPQQVVQATERTSATREEPPPTANIKPMATPSPSTATKPTPSTSGQAKVTASIRPMAITPASVPVVTAVPQTRMATVMPTSSVSQSETSQEITESVPSDTPIVVIPLQAPVQAVQPTQQTPPISEPQPAPEQGEVMTDSVPEPEIQSSVEAEMQQPQEPTVEEQETPVLPEIIITEEPSSQPEPTEPAPVPTSSVTAVTVPVKRTREEFEEADAEDRAATPPDEKKQRITAIDEQEPVVVQPNEASGVEPTESQSQSIPGDSAVGEPQEYPEDVADNVATATQSDKQEVEADDVAHEEEEEEEGEEEEDDDVVIVVDSGSDVEQYQEGEEQYEVIEGVDEDEEEEVEEEEGEGYEGEGEEEEEYGVYDEEAEEIEQGYDVGDEYEVEEAEMEDDGEEVDGEEDMEEQIDDVEHEQMEEAQDEDSDVVEIIDDDDQNSQVEMESQPLEQQQEPPSNVQISAQQTQIGVTMQQTPHIQIHVVPPEQEQQQPPASQEQPSPQQQQQQQHESSQELSTQQAAQRLPMRAERLPSLGRQLPSFSFMGHSSGTPFEDMGDDCTVPSTPTLFVPKSTDGFAEAINSPHQHVRFQFNPPEGDAGARPALAQLATQGALGMDDTHIDILGEEDGGGRSVPTTPLQSQAPMMQFPTAESTGDAPEESSQSVPVSAAHLDTGSNNDSTELTESAENTAAQDVEDTEQSEEINLEETENDNAIDLESGAAEAAAEGESQEAAEGQVESVEGDDGIGDTKVPEPRSSESEAEQKPKPTLKRIVWSSSDDGSGAGAGASTSTSVSGQQTEHQRKPAWQGSHRGRKIKRQPRGRGSIGPRGIRGGRGRGGQIM